MFVWPNVWSSTAISTWKHTIISHLAAKYCVPELAGCGDIYICVTRGWCLCGDFSGEEVIRSWNKDGSLVLLGFPLSDHRLHVGLNRQPAFSQCGREPRMQELLGGVLGDFLSEGSSRSRNVIRPESKNNQCPCRRWRCKACGALMRPALLPSSEDAGRMELIVAQS